MGSRRDLAFFALSLLALVLLIGLGIWQVQRLQWKNDLVDRITEQGKAEPLNLADIEARMAAGEDVEFMRAKATGRFVHDGELFVFSTLDGEMGWKVVTPLKTDDGGEVLVDRGFIPYDLKAPGARAGSQEAGTVSLTGAVRRYTSAPAPFVPDNDVDANVWHWWALPAMAEAAGVQGARPFILQAEPRPGDPAWPRASAPDPATLPNRHLGYAVTWFGLAAMLVIVNGLYLFRRLRNP